LDCGFGGTVLSQNTTAIFGTRLAQGSAQGWHRVTVGPADSWRIGGFAVGFLRGGRGWSAFMEMKIQGVSKNYTHIYIYIYILAASSNSVNFCPHSGGAGIYFWVPVVITESCLALVLLQHGFSFSLVRHWFFSASARRQARAPLRIETGPSRRFELS